MIWPIIYVSGILLSVITCVFESRTTNSSFLGTDKREQLFKFFVGERELRVLVSAWSWSWWKESWVQLRKWKLDFVTTENCLYFFDSFEFTETSERAETILFRVKVEF